MRKPRADSFAGEIASAATIFAAGAAAVPFAYPLDAEAAQAVTVRLAGDGVAIGAWLAIIAAGFALACIFGAGRWLARRIDRAAVRSLTERP